MRQHASALALDDLLEDLLQNLLEHLPRVSDFVHDLAKDFEAQEHVEDDLGVVGEDLVLLHHFLVHALVEDSLLRLVLDVLDALFQAGVLGDSLQGIVVGHEEVVLVGPVELALVLVVVLDLRLHLLELGPLVIVDLLQHQLLELHPGAHAELVLGDVLVAAHRDEAGALGHKEGPILVVEAGREDLDLV